jgi:hypothetical protein
MSASSDSDSASAACRAPTSLRVSTTSSGIVCSMRVKSFSASLNLPSVTILYAPFSCSSSPDRLYSSVGVLGGCVAASPFHDLRPGGRGRGVSAAGGRPWLQDVGGSSSRSGRLPGKGPPCSAQQAAGRGAWRGCGPQGSLP